MSEGPEALDDTRIVLGPVTFVITADERLAAIARTVHVILGAFGVYGGLGLGGFARMHRLSSWYVPYGAFWIVLGLLTIVLRLNVTRVRRRFIRPSPPATLTVTTEGLAISTRDHLAPWAAVRSVTDSGDVFAVDIGRRRTYVPKRIFDDGGERFWALAMDRLVGRRILVGAPSRTVIVNTTARHR